jgi:hypothetical protein
MYQQQGQEFEGKSRPGKEQEPPYGAYAGSGYESYDTPKSTYPTNGKLNLNLDRDATNEHKASWGQRLALMIVSMSLWTAVFIVIISFSVVGVSSSTLVFLFFGLVLFTLMVIGFNIAFAVARH